MIDVAKYKNGFYPFPKHDIDPNLKDAKWHLEFCKAIFGAWIAGKTGIPFSAIGQDQKLREYGAGKQNPKRYMDILLGEEETGSGERKGWLNLNWDILSVAPKFKEVVIGMHEEQDHRITCTAIDPKSGAEREAMMWEMWFKSQFKNELTEMQKGLGQLGPSDEYIPESLEELEIVNELGGFKLKKEKSIEQGLDYTFYISEWKEIKRKLIEDFIDINRAAVKDYIDLYTQKVHVRYANPSNTIMQYSRENGHRKSEWAGEIIKVNIVDLRRDTDLTEDQLRGIAQKYQKMNGNYDSLNWNSEMLDNGDGTFKYDNFWIDVLDGEWMSIDTKYRTRRVDSRGEAFIYDEKFGKVYDADNKKTSIKKFKTVYRGKWILGTEFVYDWGKQYDIPRPGRKEVELSYHYYILPGRSIMDLICPNLDNLQLAWLKFQNALAMAAPKGIAVEWSSLTNMKLGGNKMNELEILDIRRGTGDMIYRATTHKGYVHSPHAGRPVQELEGGLGSSLQEFITIFDMNLNFIRELTGINQVADASTPDPNQSVGGSQMALAGTVNALKNIYAGYITLKEGAAKNCALRLQLAVKYNRRAYGGYYPVLGKANLQVLKIGTDILDADWGLKVEAKPSEAMKDKIRGAIVEAMKPDREGYIGIEGTDYIFLERMLEAGDLKLAETIFGYRSRKNKEQQIKRQRENMELDAKNAQQLAVTKAQEAKESKKNDNELKKELVTHTETEKRKTLELEHQNKMEELTLEKSLEASMSAKEPELQTA